MDHNGSSSAPVKLENVHRHVMRRTFGAFLFLYELQYQVADLHGGLDGGDFDLARLSARNATLTCLCVQSVAVTGEPCVIGSGRMLSADPYRGLSEAVVAAALDLMTRAARADSAGEWAAWLADFARMVKQTEASLELDEPLPELRSERGLFSIIRLGRPWIPMAQDLGLPVAIPKEWL
jgi:hypothetical protein